MFTFLVNGLKPFFQNDLSAIEVKQVDTSLNFNRLSIPIAGQGFTGGHFEADGRPCTTMQFLPYFDGGLAAESAKAAINKVKANQRGVGGSTAQGVYRGLDIRIR